MYNRRNSNRMRGRCIFPGYNWCGPGCSGPGAPTNDVDACCMRHDHCLQRGIHPCFCDEEFMRCLYPKMARPTREGRHARLMYNAIRVRTLFTC